MTVDTLWFLNAVRDRGLSLRGLAREMNMDPSAISRAFRGQRRIQIDEAREIARKLQRPVEDVLRAAGLSSIDTPERLPEHLHVTASVQPDGTVVTLRPARHLSAPAPRPVAGAAVLRCGGWLDGAIVTLGAPVSVDEVIDRTAVVTLSDGTRVLGSVRRGYAGAFELETLARRIDDITVAAAHPVLSIHPR